VLLLVLAVLGVVAGVVAFVSARKADKHVLVASLPQDARVPSVQPPVDAQPEIVVVPPTDAAVLAAVPTHTATKIPRHDAGVIDAQQQQQIVMAPPGQLPVNGNGQGGPPSWGPYSPQWQAMKGGKVDVIRAAIKSIGYDGLDAKASKDELQKTIDSSSGADRAIAQTKLGMLLRKGGDCAGANPLLKDAVKTLKPFEPANEAEWRGRAGINHALCVLASGDGKAALDTIVEAINNQPNIIQLVRGIATLESGGEIPLAYGHFTIVASKGDATVKAALQTYLDGYGLKMGP
jgi:hypothetical protein